MTQNVGSEVRRIVGLVLNRNIRDDENVLRTDEPGWDSLKHVEILFAVEDGFSIRFNELELSALSSVDQIASAVETKLAP
jgi:acyl carrier protein